METKKIKKRSGRERTFRIVTIVTLLTGVLLTGCSSLDCPYENRVYTKYQLKGDVKMLLDTLTVTTNRISDGSDTILLNQAVKIDSFELPMSYANAQDVFHFHIKRTDKQTFTDTVIVNKKDQTHFESVDCNPAYFHTLTGISYTTHAIDSIVIHNTQVNYDASQPHFYIYFRYHD
jgi:hypothetical protein